MNNLELDNLTDTQLSEVFAIEVAKIIKCDKWGPSFHPLAGVMKTDCGHENCHPDCFWPPKFATDANLVIPFIESAGMMSDCECRSGTWNIQLDVYSDTRGRMARASGEFSRAACIALILKVRNNNE